MQVSVEKISNISRKITIGIPADQVDPGVEKKLQEASRKVRLNGFRPGKVPMKVVRKRYGESVRAEVLGELMQNALVEALESNDINPVGRPEYDLVTNEPGRDVEYSVTLEVMPEVELGDLSSLSVEREIAEVEESDIDEMIASLQKQRATWEKVERPVQQGDRVTIDYAGLCNGEAFEGGSAEGSQLVIGSGQMIPGFEDGIVGMKVGEEKDINLKFPESYHAEALAGQDAVFHITLHNIEEQILPALDQAFFSGFGVEEDSLDAFRADVRKQMERELGNALKTKLKQRVANAMVTLHQGLEVPSSMIGQEIRALKQQMAQSFGASLQGLDIDQLGLPDDMFRPKAEFRARSGLIFGQLIKDLGLEADEEITRRIIEEMASAYQDSQEVIDWYYENAEQLEQVKGLSVEEQAIDRVLSQAQVTETRVSYQDALRPDPEPDYQASSEAVVSAEAGAQDETASEASDQS
jgi:trigger factor